ncbi:CYTH domain-containing protein [Candidatus Pacearchaeota archaeon]|nr:CYTH domain-containing protein [Candidatus Pacearchaeota archaeon]
MEIEYEAMFKDINKDEIRKKLKDVGARLVKPEFLQKREIFKLGDQDINKWIRLRDEGDKITLTYKELLGNAIDSQKELLIIVNDFQKTSKILEITGLKKIGFQENNREVWMINNVEIMIDSWPFIDPLVEIEGKSEEDVKKTSELLGFDYNKAIFGSVEILYSEKYGIDKIKLCNHAPILKFDMKNPFIK